MRPDLSFIIPVYNVEQFLAKCLHSIINNDWLQIQYEIVIVDDASPDQSLNIALEFSKQYANIKVISQENKGLGGARNTGIKEAKGNYLFFLDSDDFLKPNKIQKIIQTALDYKLDILEFGAERTDENYNFIDRIFFKQDSQILDGLSYLAIYNFENSVCNKLYRKMFLIDNNIEFFEKTYIEDAPFNAEAFSKAKMVKSLPITPVVFYQNRNSITRQKRTGENLRKFIGDSIKVTVKINEIATLAKMPKAQVVLQERVAVFTSGIILMILKSEFTLFDKKKYINQLYDCNLYPVKNYSGIFLRDVFILLINFRSFLQFLLRIIK